MQLSLATLAKLGLAGVAVPNYDPAKLSPGIVHVGIGNFHRAHQARYLDDLFNLDENSNTWGIVGATTRAPSKVDRRAILKKQDWLQTLLERDAESTRARVIGSMVDFLPAEPDHAQLLSKLTDPAIKIVSMTVTEGGYYLHPSTSGFDDEHPKIKADAANPDAPQTLFGIIVKALKDRREAGTDPFAVMCCDNIPHCGDVTKEVVVGLAALSDKELAEWISDNVGFPNGMVDRITPATTGLEKKLVKDMFGYEDELPVPCEPFCQWVLEDDFPHGRPALEKVGVQFVPDVTPFETMKIRILNGGHATLTYPAALLGIEYVHDAMEHPVIGAFLDTVERHEILPGVPPVPKTSRTEYWELIEQRFYNPTICDRIDRNCADGSDRQPKFIIPPAGDCLKDGRDVDGLALVSAMWCRYCQGKTEDGKDIPIEDPIVDELKETAQKAASGDPTVWLDMGEIYGEVGQNPKFRESFASAFKLISEEGIETAMKQYVEKVEGKKNA